MAAKSASQAEVDIAEQLARGATMALAEIENQRQRIKALRKRISDIEAAPVGSAEIAARVARLVEEARGSVIASAGLSGIASPEAAYRESSISVWLDGLPAFQVAALMDADRLKAKLTAEAEAAASDWGHAPVSEAERRESIRKATADILAAEVACELYCRRLESAGLGVARDTSADPAVLLAPTAELEAFNGAA